MLFTVCSRRDLDARKALSEDEFSIIPKALFTPCGHLHINTNSINMNNLASQSAASPTVQSSNVVAIIDHMSEVQRFYFPSNAASGLQLFHKLHQIKFVDYRSVNFIFDQYDKESMNNHTRAKRYDEKAVGSIYIPNSTDISKTTMVNILTSTEAKS